MQRESDAHDVTTAIRFHGHFCPGLAYGIQAVRLARKALFLETATDEEIVTIAECDACGVDAFQSLLGTTTGKGNLILTHMGKHAWTVYCRKTGKGVRLIRQETIAALDGFRSKPESPDPRGDKARFMLTLPPETLYRMEAPKEPMPGRARLEKSVPCDRCQERTMASMLLRVNDKSLCLACARRECLKT